MPTDPTRNMISMGLALTHCPFCGEPINSLSASRDHIIPRWAGGSNDYRNKIWACGTCNNIIKKGKVFARRRLRAKTTFDAIGKIYIPEPAVRKNYVNGIRVYHEFEADRSAIELDANLGQVSNDVELADSFAPMQIFTAKSLPAHDEYVRIFRTEGLLVLDLVASEAERIANEISKHLRMEDFQFSQSFCILPSTYFYYFFDTNRFPGTRAEEFIRAQFELEGG